MCFAPPRRALFRHLNFQKWSEHGVFWAFWLRNVLRATTACTFSTSQLPKVLRSRGVLYILTWKRASRHNGVQFFISHLASWLCTCRFSEPTFRPAGATNHWKNIVFRSFATFLPFLAPGSSFLGDFLFLIFFLLLFSSLNLPISAFHLSILSEVWLLNFLRLYTHDPHLSTPTSPTLFRFCAPGTPGAPGVPAPRAHAGLPNAHGLPLYAEAVRPTREWWWGSQWWRVCRRFMGVVDMVWTSHGTGWQSPEYAFCFCVWTLNTLPIVGLSSCPLLAEVIYLTCISCQRSAHPLKGTTSLECMDVWNQLTWKNQQVTFSFPYCSHTPPIRNPNSMRRSWEWRSHDWGL